MWSNLPLRIPEHPWGETQPVAAPAPAENGERFSICWMGTEAQKDISELSAHSEGKVFGEAQHPTAEQQLLAKAHSKIWPWGPAPGCLQMRSNRNYKKLNMVKIAKQRTAQKSPHFHQARPSPCSWWFCVTCTALRYLFYHLKKQEP